MYVWSGSGGVVGPGLANVPEIPSLAGPINTRHKLISRRKRPKNAPAHALSSDSRNGDAEYRNGDRG